MLGRILSAIAGSGAALLAVAVIGSTAAPVEQYAVAASQSVSADAPVKADHPPCPWEKGCQSSEGRRVELKRNVKVNDEGDTLDMWWDHTRDFRDNFCANVMTQAPQHGGSFCGGLKPPM
ncbi:hypothetical protein ACFVFQ_01465 [Streptomyces sp. NPDC057743]|uniref:hypothetical protein n=1 Tax=Streptomyces sp. NPDC057743 TaxID=3346236 RepID=UPI0036C8830F